MNKMINDLLAASKDICSQLTVAPVRVNLVNITEEIVNNLQNKLSEKAVYY